MAEEVRDRQRKSYTVMKRIYDLTMSVLFLGMATVMLLADKLHIERLTNPDNDMFRYFFGSICLLYGGFRLYRGIKGD